MCSYCFFTNDKITVWKDKENENWIDNTKRKKKSIISNCEDRRQYWRRSGVPPPINPHLSWLYYFWYLIFSRAKLYDLFLWRQNLHAVFNLLNCSWAIYAVKRNYFRVCLLFVCLVRRLKKQQHLKQIFFLDNYFIKSNILLLCITNNINNRRRWWCNNMCMFSAIISIRWTYQLEIEQKIQFVLENYNGI